MKKKSVAPPPLWEVVDVELAHIFTCENLEEAEVCRASVELIGHRAIVKEVPRS